jgi:hypothetical protein
MNASVTSNQPVCLYSDAGEKGEPSDRVHWLNGGPPSARNINRFSITSSGKVFFGPSAFRSLRVFADRARYEKMIQHHEGATVGDLLPRRRFSRQKTPLAK